MTLSIQRLHGGYGSRKILHDIDIILPKEKIIALVGPNGCGKSTLLKTIARLLPISAGRIELQGQSIHDYSTKRFAQKLALLPQHHLVPEGIDVRTLVSYGRSPYLNLWGRLRPQDEIIVEEVMQQTDTLSLAEKRLDQLSGGQQQRAFLAMALAQQTPYLLLDEPTTYLDLNHQINLMNLMRQVCERGTTVITVLHDLNQAARYCDYLLVLKQGRLVTAGTPQEVMTREMLADVFAIDAESYPCPISQRPMCIIRDCCQRI